MPVSVRGRSQLPQPLLLLLLLLMLMVVVVVLALVLVLAVVIRASSHQMRPCVWQTPLPEYTRQMTKAGNE